MKHLGKRSVLTALLMVAAAAAVMILGLTVWTRFHEPEPEPVVVEVVPAPVEHYVRIAAVYEGNIDFRFLVTKKLLENSAKDFIGKPILLSHNWSDPNLCVGWIVDAAVKRDVHGHYIEVIAKLNRPVVADAIRRNIYHAVSIGFQTIQEYCTICNADVKECKHEMGQWYKKDGKWIRARNLLVEIKPLEVSFINIPASSHARVLELATHPLTCVDSK